MRLYIYINQRDCISDSLISSGDPGVQPADTTSSAEIKNDPLDPIFDVDYDSDIKNGHSLRRFREFRGCKVQLHGGSTVSCTVCLSTLPSVSYE